MNDVSVATPDWRSAASTLEPRNRAFVDGRFVNSHSAERTASVNPASLDTICEIPSGCVADVNVAVDAARRSFEDGRWASKTPLERKQILMRVGALIDAHADELALLDTLEMGKPISSSRAEVGFASGFFRFNGEAIDKLVGDLLPSEQEVLSLGRYEPRGVVGAIVPWNFPLINAALKAAPALAAGNSIVLKPSELASLSAIRLAELAFEAGVPEGVFNVVPGLGSTVGEALALHSGVDFLTFTGSSATGRRLLVMAGESNGKPLMLECGGKSPQIVCEDMTPILPEVAAHVAHDAFWNQGQWCAARSRLLVEASIYDALLEAVADIASKLKPGDPLEPDTRFGTLASRGQFERVSGFVDRAIKAGARSLTGFSTADPCPLSMAPIVFADITSGMEVTREEVFGPVLAVSKFREFDEAIALANGTDYGLSATLWTRDQRRAHRAAREIRAGKLLIRANHGHGEMSGFAQAAEPWGASGYGIEGGMAGLRSYSRLKAIEFLC